MTSMNKLQKTALCLILLAAVFTINLAEAATEDDYKADTYFLTNIYEGTTTEGNYKANIITNPITTGIYAKENGYKTNLTVNPEGIGGQYTENNIKTDLIPEKTFPEITLRKVGDLGGGVPPTFFNFDWKVDGKDLALFLQCFKGLVPPEAMILADFGGSVPPKFFKYDGKVDGKDLSLFLQCFKGQGPDS